MRVLGAVYVAVAARLHGVLLAHVAGRPALAIAHERKVGTLMADMGHGRWCLDIDDFDAGIGWTRLEELCTRSGELAADVERKVAALRRRVDEQYDLVFGAL
jgi:polysaccharide pyruvyl transferase WcaK-like protein